MPQKQSRLKALTKGAKGIVDKVLDNPFRKIGVTWLQLRVFKYFPKKGLQHHYLFGNPTYFYNTHEYFSGLKEIFIDEVYLQNLPENAFVLDCGTHIGLSIIYLKRLCPAATIVAFEPDYKNFNLLQKNLESHDLKSVEIRNEAVWTANTTLDFIADGNMGSKIGSSQADTVKVKATRLRDYLTRKVDFLKIDIEGAEFEVLKDIEDLLANVQNLFLEYHGYYRQNSELNHILNVLVQKNFKYYLKEAMQVYKHPFASEKKEKGDYDVQLNIFAFKDTTI